MFGNVLVLAYACCTLEHFAGKTKDYFFLWAILFHYLYTGKHNGLSNTLESCKAAAEISVATNL